MGARRKKREGRGYLSSIDLLPDDAQPIIDWAMEELRARNHTQGVILEEFNKRLKELSIEINQPIDPISYSAFNRHSLALAKRAKRLEQTRDIARILNKRLGAQETDDLTVIVGETIKTLIFEMLEQSDDDKISTKGAQELASAFKSAVQAQKMSSDRVAKIEKDFVSRADDAIEKVEKEAGLTKEQTAQIRRDVLGVR